MMIYGKVDPPSLSDIESLLLVQESQLDKYRQELAVTTVAANVAHTSAHTVHDSSSSTANQPNTRGGYYFGRGRGRQGRARGRGRACTTGPRPMCQLCGRYGHAVLDCWFRFDESFVPPPTTSQPSNTSSANPASSTTPTSDDTCTPQVSLAEAMTLDATGIPSDLQSHSNDEPDWYGDTGATHHVTDD